LLYGAILELRHKNLIPLGTESWSCVREMDSSSCVLLYKKSTSL